MKMSHSLKVEGLKVSLLNTSEWNIVQTIGKTANSIQWKGNNVKNTYK
jgi:hypothetical protein